MRETQKQILAKNYEYMYLGCKETQVCLDVSSLLIWLLSGILIYKRRKMENNDMSTK
ncbi:hypothetical protein KSX_20030 [Ktedonospora formicarum]|uniref:Uncharacterized protein n=1 Tax=Ktedonospora formicarum TaxID=2778364 RepID=A0A8J3MQC3_9CHLR|nr:hypothetical protein KSX_20030 [Ktedonospora formicarum]